MSRKTKNGGGGGNRTHRPEDQPQKALRAQAAFCLRRGRARSRAHSAAISMVVPAAAENKRSGQPAGSTPRPAPQARAGEMLAAYAARASSDLLAFIALPPFYGLVAPRLAPPATVSPVETCRPHVACAFFLRPILRFAAPGAVCRHPRSPGPASRATYAENRAPEPSSACLPVTKVVPTTTGFGRPGPARPAPSPGGPPGPRFRPAGRGSSGPGPGPVPLWPGPRGSTP